MTEEYAASAFAWKRDSGNAGADATWNAAHAGKKAITLTEADLNGDVKITCTLTGNGPGYGSIAVDEDMDATHTRGTLDANDTFQIVNGELKVTTSRGNVYALEDGKVKGAGAKLNGSITAETKLFASQPEDVVEFSYDHNGLRTQKKVTKADGTVETTDYILHGKLVTHLTRGSDEMHFFYDAQGRPAMVEFNGALYSYVHNLQGDIVGILDNAGSLVVEYKYDAWGKPLSTTGTLADTLGKRNPFRYRGYMFDEETGLYYLNSRYYNPRKERFINGDCEVGLIGSLCSHAVFTYCFNEPVDQADYDGKRSETNTWINFIVESFVRNLINTICGREHASGEVGEFSITSVTKDITITSEDADSHNGAVSTGISAISFITGYVLTSAISGLKYISKALESAAGGYVMDSVSGAIQDEIAGWFTVRAGTYTSIRCQYERNFKILWFIPGLELHSYELRLYPDYCEVWYSYMYSGFGSQITIPQKVGEMTMSELQEAFGS